MTARPFTLPHFRRWARELTLDGGQPWTVEPWQASFLRDVFRGVPEVWLIVPEGNGKTTTLAGLGLYHAEFRPFAAVPVAAASREQAEILYRQAEGFVIRSDRLHESVHSAIQEAKGKRKVNVPRFTCLEGYRRINHHSGSRIQVFAADDRTGDGILPTLAIIDEPHRLRDLSLYRTWAGKIAKREGQIVAISTRGEPGSEFEETLNRIRDSATERTTRGSFTRYATSRVVLHEWAVPDAADVDDIRAVKRANPFSGITVPMLREKHDSPTTTRHHWLRFVCNRPTEDDDAWLGPDGRRLWDGAEDDGYGLVLGAATWVGVDVGIKRDSSAVVAVQLREDGRLHAELRSWLPTVDEPVDVTDIMAHLRDLANRYRVGAISFDPRFFDVPAKMLYDEGLPLVEIPQSIEHMTPACGHLYELIRSQRITHRRDPVFTQQVLNGVPRFNERGFTLSKGKSRNRIDAGVALALAVDRATHQKKPRAPLVIL